MAGVKIKEIIEGESVLSGFGACNYELYENYYIILDNDKNTSYVWRTFYNSKFGNLFIRSLNFYITTGYIDDYIIPYDPEFKSLRFRIYEKFIKENNKSYLYIDVIGDNHELTNFCKKYELKREDEICVLHPCDYEYIYQRGKDPKYICGEIDSIKNDVDTIKKEIEKSYVHDIDTKLKLVVEENDKLKKKVDDMEKIIHNMNELLIAFNITNK